MALPTKDQIVLSLTVLFLAVCILYSKLISSFLKQSDSLISENPMMCGYSKKQMEKIADGDRLTDENLSLNRTAYHIIADRDNTTGMIFVCSSFHDEGDCLSVGCSWMRNNRVDALEYIPVMEMLGSIPLLVIFAVFDKWSTKPTTDHHVVTNKFVWVMTFASISINVICGTIFVHVKSFASAISILIMNACVSYSSMLPLIVCFIRANIRSGFRGQVLFMMSCLQYISDIFTLVVGFRELEEISTGTADQYILKLICVGVGLLVINLGVVIKMSNWAMRSFGEQVANAVSTDTCAVEDAEVGSLDDDRESTSGGSVLDNTSQTRMMEDTTSVATIRNSRKVMGQHLKVLLKKIGFLPVFLIMFSYFIRSCSEILNTTLMNGGLLEEDRIFSSMEMSQAHALVIGFKIATIFCLYFSVAESDTYRFEPQRRFNKLAGFTMFATFASGIIVNMQVSSMASYIYCLYHLFGSSWIELSLLTTAESMDQYDRSSPNALTLISAIGAIGSLAGVKVFDAIETTSTGLKTWAGCVTASFLLCCAAALANRTKLKKNR